MDAVDESVDSRRPMRADARQNRERLIQAASQAFSEVGPNVCLEDIARHARVGVGTLYRHFPNRQALLEAVYRDQIDAMLAESTALLDHPSPGEALDAWMRMVLNYTLKQRGLKETLLNNAESSVVAQCKQQLRAAGDAMIVRAQQAGVVRPDVRSTDLLRLIHGIVQVTEQTPEGREQAQRLIEIMMAGVHSQAS